MIKMRLDGRYAETHADNPGMGPFSIARFLEALNRSVDRQPAATGLLDHVCAEPANLAILIGEQLL